MINEISSWASSIVIAVIISTIIEMILPDTNNKKYVKTVIGVFILFTIVAPIVTKVSKDNFSLKDVIANTSLENINKIEQLDTSKDIEKTYIISLKADLINKVAEKGYNAKEINIKVDMQEGQEYGRIKSISFRIEKNENTDEVAIVNTISIDIKENEKKEDLEKQTEEIRTYITSVYGISKEIVNVY